MSHRALVIAFVLALPLSAGAQEKQAGAIDARVTTVTGHDTKQGWAGLRVAITRVAGENGTSLQFAGRGEELKTRGVFSSHGAHMFGIGGGTAGFDGGLGVLLTFGPRIPIAPHHGPFVRAGLRGHLLGNRALYSSLLELPRGELGYQFIRGWTVLEVGASYGAVLTGRYRAGDANTLMLGTGFAPGGYIALQLPVLRVGASVARLPVRDGATIDNADAHACVIGAPLALCGDASFTRGEVVRDGKFETARGWYSGVTLAVVPPALPL